MGTSDDLTNFLNRMLNSKVKLCYKTFQSYYAILLLVDDHDHQLKIHSINPKNCKLETFETPLEVQGYLNAFNITTYINNPDTLNLIWRLQLVINDIPYIISMDSDPIIHNPSLRISIP